MEGPQGKKEEPGQIPSAPAPQERDEGKSWAGVLTEMREMKPCSDCGELRRKLVKVCPNCEGLQMRRDSAERDKARLAHYVRDVDANIAHRHEFEKILHTQVLDHRSHNQAVVAAIDRQTKAFERLATTLEEFVKPRIKVVKKRKE